MVDSLLYWFVRVWVGLFLASVLVSIVGFFVVEPTILAGLERFWATFSPFNIINWLAVTILLSPAVLANSVLNKRKAKA